MSPGQDLYHDFVTRAWQNNTITTANLELTYDCNLKCSFCYNPVIYKNAVTTQEFKRVIDQCADLNVIFLTLTGGEPLVHPDFFEIAQHGKEQGFALRIYTNAALIGTRNADRIKELNPFVIETSIHGADAKTHESLTLVPGSFQKLLEAVERLREREIRVIMKTVVTVLNQDQVWDIKAIGDRYGCDVHFDTKVTPTDDGDTSPLNLGTSLEYRKKFWSEIYPEMNDWEPKPVHDESSVSNCSTGATSVTIDPDGNVYPCTGWRRKLGNIKEQTIQQIWETSPMLKQVRQLAIDAEGALRKQTEAWQYVTHCLGTAEQETGDPLQLGEQTILDAEARKWSAEVRMQNSCSACSHQS